MTNHPTPANRKGQGGPGHRPDIWVTLWERLIAPVKRWHRRRSKQAYFDTDYIIRSLALEERPPSKVAQTAIWTSCLCVLSLIGWASFATLDERVVATGTILPQRSIQSVQHLEGGIISSIDVKNGDYVKAGDRLLVMASAVPRSQFSSLSARLNALRIQIEQLNAFATDQDLDLLSGGSGGSTFASIQKILLDTKLAARDAKIKVLEAQIASRQKEVDGLEENRTALEKELSLQTKELELRKDLMEKGLMSKLAILAAQKETVRIRGTLARTVTEIARAKTNIAEADGRVVELKEKLRTDAFEQLSQLTTEYGDVSNELKALKDRVRRLHVTAPAPGIISNMAAISSGSVVSPGQILLDIVPDQTELIAEVFVSPRDIGRVMSGMDAIIRVETFDYAKHGSVGAQVYYVAASTTKTENSLPFFRTRLRLDRSHIGADRHTNAITPGMTLSAEIKTGQRTLLAYLLKPIARSLGTSFSER